MPVEREKYRVTECLGTSYMYNTWGKVPATRRRGRYWLRYVEEGTGYDTWRKVLATIRGKGTAMIHRGRYWL